MILFLSFFVNLLVTFDPTSLKSSVHAQEIDIFSDDLHEYLQLSISIPSIHSKSGDNHHNWYKMNIVLRVVTLSYHDSKTSTLILNACIIQHMVLRNNVILNARDHVHVSPLLYVIIYFILLHSQLNIIDLLI